MKRILVVGAGFSGSVIARELAETDKVKVDIIEQRNHIAGNMYDEFDENGIIIQKYGPHYFNSYKYSLIEYLSKFGDMRPFNVKALSFIDGKHIRLPWNFQSIQEMMPGKDGAELITALKKQFDTNKRIPLFKILDSDNQIIKQWGETLFNKAFANYMVKQWGIPAEQVDKSVVGRVPMVIGYDERYLETDYQVLPVSGFTTLFKNMLNHKNIKITLNTDALDKIILDDQSNRTEYNGEKYDIIVYTGAIDELFNYAYGKLSYRSLDIHYETVKRENGLIADIVSYPQEKYFTRKTDYGRFNTVENNGSTVIATEYPMEYDKSAKKGNLPYYPVLSEENIIKYNKYKTDAGKYHNLYLCGRLAEFKYYNMDAAVENALNKSEEIKNTLGL